MLERHQVLLEDWQFEAIKNMALQGECSIAEALRYVVNIGLQISKGKITGFGGRDATGFETRKQMQKRGIIK